MISLIHVRNHAKVFAAGSFDLSGYLVQEFAVDVDRHNSCSFLREQRGRRSADSRGPPLMIAVLFWRFICELLPQYRLPESPFHRQAQACRHLRLTPRQ